MVPAPGTRVHRRGASDTHTLASLRVPRAEGLIAFYERYGFETYDLTTEIAGDEEPFVQMAYWRTHPEREPTPPPEPSAAPDWSGRG